MTSKPFTICLWFDSQGEEPATPARSDPGGREAGRPAVIEVTESG